MALPETGEPEGEAGPRTLQSASWAPLASGLAAAGLVVAYCVARYGDAVLTFFFFDDFSLLRASAEPEVVSFTDLASFFSPTGNRLYRPLTQVSYFFVLRQLFGYDASGYHALQLAVFALNSLLVFALAWRLLGSRSGALVAALLYAAAPGHALAVYWIAAFTMTGTATLVLLMLLWWLSTRGAWRACGCALLQAVALLGSEHAVTGPVLIACLTTFAPGEVGRRRALAQLAPTALLASSYLVAKLAYLFAAGPPSTAYRMTLDPLAWLDNLGGYLSVCLNLLAWWAPGRGVRIGLAAACLVFTALASWHGLRATRWRLVALGSCLWLVALLPVVPLADHHTPYYVGLAAAGAALAIVGLLKLTTSHWRWLATALLAAVLATDVATDNVAAQDGGLRSFRRGSNVAAAWLLSVQTAGDDASVIFVPGSRTTNTLFARLRIERLFLADPPAVEVYDPSQPPTPGPGRLVLRSPSIRPGRGDSLPGWSARWDWLREALPWPRQLIFGQPVSRPARRAGEKPPP